MPYVNLTLRLSFDDLDAAVERALYGKVASTRDKLTEQSASYRLPFGDDDSLGEVYVRGLPGGQSELVIQGNPIPSPQILSCEELDMLHEIAIERVDRYQRKDQRFSELLDSFLGRLSDDRRLLEALEVEGFQSLVVDCKSDSDALRQVALQYLGIAMLPADTTEPARTEAVGELVRQWKADEVTDLDLLRGLSELGIDVLELPDVHQGTSSKPAKQAELLGLARRYLKAKEYDPDVLQGDIGPERTVRRGVALYKAIEKLA